VISLLDRGALGNIQNEVTLLSFDIFRRHSPLEPENYFRKENYLDKHGMLQVAGEDPVDLSV
jgi:hypothetical protein